MALVRNVCRGITGAAAEALDRPVIAYTQNLVSLAATTGLGWGTGIGGPANVTEFVFSCWLKLNSFSAASFYALIDQLNFSTGFCYFHSTSGSSNWTMQIGNHTAAFAVTKTSDNAAGENTSLHHHCAIFRKGGTNKLYIDGTDYTSTTNAWISASPDNEVLNMSKTNQLRVLMGANGAGTLPANSQVGDLFVAFDLNGRSDAQILRALSGADGATPQRLTGYGLEASGPWGTLVTGNQPAIYFGGHQTASDWQAGTNLGTATDPGTIYGTFSDV